MTLLEEWKKDGPELFNGEWERTESRDLYTEVSPALYQRAVLEVLVRTYTAWGQTMLEWEEFESLTRGAQIDVVLGILLSAKTKYGHFFPRKPDAIKKVLRLTPRP